MIDADSVTSAPWWKRFWQHPLTQVIARIVIFALLVILLARALQFLLPHKPVGSAEKAMALSGADLWLMALRSLVPVALAYWLLVRWIERRRVTELAANKFLTHGAAGWLIGMGIMVLTAAALALVGAYRIQGINPDVYLVGPLVVLGLLPGITEEIVARGILFRVVEEGLGTWIALAISAALFGFGHAANPNATLWSSLAIAIEAGLLLGMAYAWTRSLWFCMGLHAAWNFTQGPLLGIPVSGFDLKGLLNSSTQGPVLLSGGEFGAEASILTVLVCVSLAGFFTRKAIDEGRIIAPFWRRAKLPAPAPAPVLVTVAEQAE